MPWIDPHRVREAAAHLRAVADAADDVQITVRRGLTLSELPPGQALTGCREIDEELNLLASLLVLRADRVEGFQLGLSPAWSDEARSRLFASLLDHDGPRAVIRGDLAIEILLDHRSRFDAVAPAGEPTSATVISEAELDALLLDPASPPELVAAITELRGRAGWLDQVRSDVDHLWSGVLAGPLPPGAITVEALELMRRRNELITRLHHDALTHLLDPTRSRFSAEELQRLGTDSVELDALDLTSDHGEIVAAAIEYGTFLHSPNAARNFISSLPIHRVHGTSLDIRDIDGGALRRLHETATADLGETDRDLATRLEIIAHLPEASDGYRNRQITRGYAEIARRYEHAVNGLHAFQPTEAGHRGANWFFFGTIASDSVGPAIRGELTVYGMPIPHEARQDVADGNQAIFSDFVEDIGPMLRGFSAEQPLIARGFELMEEARIEPDPTRRQALMLESTALFGMHEQLVVDDYLQLDNLTNLQDLGSVLLSTIGGHKRNTQQIFTDEATLMIRDVDGTELAPAIRVGSPVVAGDDPNNLVADVDLCATIGEPFCTAQTEADEWGEYGERMPVIGEVFKHHLTDPAIFTAVASYPPLTPPRTNDPAPPGD